MLSATPHYHSQDICTLVIEKEWQIARARNHVKEIAINSGFSKVYTAQLITSLSELGYNLLFHSDGGGSVYVSRLSRSGVTGIKLLCIDHGPGIASLTDALTDGYSTNGGLGGGLPGIERLMDEFQIESNKQGTRIECIKWDL